MITYVPNTTLVGARVWYAIENGELYIPAVVVDQRDAIITLKCLSRDWRPRLDTKDPDHAARLYWRTGFRIKGDPRVEYHSVHRPKRENSEGFI